MVVCLSFFDEGDGVKYQSFCPHSYMQVNP